MADKKQDATKPADAEKPKPPNRLNINIGVNYRSDLAGPSAKIHEAITTIMVALAELEKAGVYVNADLSIRERTF
jgi:hypothetical protein